MSDTVLKLESLSLVYRMRTGWFGRGQFRALDSLDFSVEKGEVLGVIGRNGCGKSSLLRVLSGIVDPSSGRITCEKGCRRALLTLGLGFRPDLSGEDNAVLSMMYQGASFRQAHDCLESINEFAELGEFLGRPVRTYSAGMRSRLGFATAMQSQVDVLLIDEVLSVGDAHFRDKAAAAIQNRLHGLQTAVFVSHSTNHIRSICDRVIWLDKGRLMSEGSPDQVLSDYADFIKTLEDDSSAA